MEAELVKQFGTLGIVGVMAYYLFKNAMTEKKEDRDLYRDSVKTFTETSKSYAESITALTSRVENVEEGTERIERKLDEVLEKVGV